jgi:predicted aconitase with swiveling domain
MPFRDLLCLFRGFGRDSPGPAVGAAYLVSGLAAVYSAPAYYVITAAGIVLALGVIVAMFPLLRRVTGPEAARNE